MAHDRTRKRTKPPGREHAGQAASASSPDASSGDVGSLDESGGHDFPVVGIGASAGGLEAFGELLKHLPRDTGMAFILIQHLDPSHESMLTALLARAAPMPVHEAQDGVEYAPNCAYVIPPNTYLAITDGILRLTPRPETRGAPMPIDYFFRSLAEHVGSMSIGIVLSGTGSDGASGLVAIKAQGGLTFAQDETATYGGMPRAAVQAGAVDFVLPPTGIAGELARIARTPGALGGAAAKESSGLVDGSADLRRDARPDEASDGCRPGLLQAADPAAPAGAADAARERADPRRLHPARARASLGADEPTRRHPHQRDELLPRSRDARRALSVCLPCALQRPARR